MPSLRFMTLVQPMQSMARIAVTDGMANDAVELLKQAGHEVVLGFIEPELLSNGALKDFDAIVVRSATKLPAATISIAVMKMELNALLIQLPGQRYRRKTKFSG